MTSLKTSLNSRRFSIRSHETAPTATPPYVTSPKIRSGLSSSPNSSSCGFGGLAFRRRLPNVVVYSWFDYKLSAGTDVGGSLFCILRAGRFIKIVPLSGIHRLSHACPHGDGRVDPVSLTAGAVSYRVRGRGICTDDTAHGLVKEVSVTRCMCSYAVASSAFVLSTLSRGSDRSVLHPCSRLLARPDQMAR